MNHPAYISIVGGSSTLRNELCVTLRPLSGFWTYYPSEGRWLANELDRSFQAPLKYQVITLSSRAAVECRFRCIDTRLVTTQRQSQTYLIVEVACLDRLASGWRRGRSLEPAVAYYLRPGWASAPSVNRLYGQVFLLPLGFGGLCLSFLAELGAEFGAVALCGVSRQSSGGSAIPQAFPWV